MSDQVSLDDNRIRLEGRLNERCALWVIAKVREATQKWSQADLILDFEDCSRAWPEGMLPVICQVELLRREGCTFGLVPPRDETLRRLFLNANWAHFIAPEQYEAYNLQTPLHLPATWYDEATHKDIVDRAVEIIMGNMEIERPVLAGLEWSVNEITDNVLNHAESPVSGLVQVSTQRESHRIRFVVADAGRGILESMRERFPSLPEDRDGITEAVKQGVTSDPEDFQGNGLAGTLRVATMSGGSFSILSGQALLSVYADSSTFGEYEDHWSRLSPSERYQGTVVSVELDSSSPLRLEDALGFQSADWEPFDYIDADYTSPDGRMLVLRLGDESAGVRSRVAGRQVRTKCLNLLHGDPTMPLVLDWGGVPLVSSSFADEAIGKLYAELGPLTFGSRVHSINMEPLVRNLIEQAMVQRMAQRAAERGSPPSG